VKFTIIRLIVVYGNTFCNKLIMKRALGTECAIIVLHDWCVLSDNCHPCAKKSERKKMHPALPSVSLMAHNKVP